MKELAYLNKYLARYKGRLFLGFVFVALSNVFQVMQAPVVRYGFDLIKETLDLHFIFQGTANQQQIYDIFIWSVFFYGGLIILMALVRGIFLFFMRQTIIVASRFIEYDLKNEIYAHYQRLPLMFYRNHNTGDLVARISEDVSKVRMYLGPAIMYTMNLVTLSVIVISFMFMVNAHLTLWTLLPLPVLSLCVYLVHNHIEYRSKKIQESLSYLSTYVQEAFAGIRVLKAFARERKSTDTFAKESNVYKTKSLDLIKVNALFLPLIVALVGISTLITVFVGGTEVIKGNITAGNIAEFIMYVNMLTWPFTSIGWVTSIVQRAEASQKRINEFLSTQSEIVSDKNLYKPVTGKIIFDHVSFVYQDSGIRALHDINLHIEAGETVAILGGTGAGKSTLANLVCRMFDVSEGAIYIDDHNIKDYNIGHLREHIGYIPQDVFLFSDSIKNNLLFGTDKDDDQLVEKYARQADLYDNIREFPQKFETRTGERGISLSGGQKQRLAIARALAHNPQILVMDDCLSALDTQTENKILNNIKEELKVRTTIIISHKVTSAKFADKIVILEAGKLIESGTHEQLMREAGMYASMYNKQVLTETANR